VSPLRHKPVRIGRAERVLRDDRIFVVATEDTDAPRQYFEHLPIPRVRVVVLETPRNSGQSAPVHVIDRLKAAFESARETNEVQNDDEFWAFLDTDHHTGANHIQEQPKGS